MSSNFIDQCRVAVHGELHAALGTDVENDVKIKVDLYDSRGVIVAGTWDVIEADTFYGFESFGYDIDIPTGVVVTRVRVHPALA